MRTTIDKAGRVVIPKSLRAHVGLGVGEVEISVDGAALRIEPVAGASLVSKSGLLVVQDSTVNLSVADVQGLRDADQR